MFNGGAQGLGPTFYSVLEATLKQEKIAPREKLFIFVDAKGKESHTLSSQQINSRARQIAYYLRIEKKLQPGDRVVLTYPPGLEFVEAFLACLFARIIPVPVFPPAPLKPELGLVGYTQITKDSGAVAQLTSQEYSLGRTFGRLLDAFKHTSHWPNLSWIITDKINGKLFDTEQVAQNDLAFLQYTSGSTRFPKGVAVTHGNLWAQIDMLTRGTGLEKNSVGLFWMPHYHDFCLIAAIASAFYLHHQVVLFSPLSFLSRPSLWMELLSRYLATHTGSPDFGYKLVTRKTTTTERKQWNLSALKCAATAAEMIRPQTVDNFLSTFSESKLSPEAMCPTYGLAEYTLAVSMFGKKRFVCEREKLEQEGKVVLVADTKKSERVIELIGCGKPIFPGKVKIVHAELHHELPSDQVGEIWLDSASKASGYFAKEEETRQKFRAKIKNQDGEWLRTGDLGFLMEEELVVVGRIDDQIIIDGKNFFPQDIEEITAQSSNLVKAGRVIAFSTPTTDQGVQVVVVLELIKAEQNDEQYQTIAQKIRELVQQELGFFKMTLVFAQSGAIPKTTSGKLQRTKCRQLWMTQQLPVLKIDRAINC